MATREIWHEVLTQASPSPLYEALTEPKKLAHWWTIDVRGQSALGEQLEFWFSGFRGSVMEVTSLQKDQLVRWRVIDGGAVDWIGTEIEFMIFQEQGKTMLHFRHSRWKEDAKAFPHCSMGWAIFLLSLKEFVETGKGRPHPYDMPVNLWQPPE
ncbi:MAG TPA: SRPBCC domain-containing protein [Candidatus Eisenbacteria bacterium]|nr:SRPBCC domain-containing protein [Candidatus Eisenbacteria bacterium]